MAMLHEVEVAFKLHPDVRSMDENWFGKSNSFDRRKLQNRLNQRALRRRKLAEKQYREESSIKGHVPGHVIAATGTSLDTLASAPVPADYCNYRLDMLKHRQIMLAKDSMFANFGQVVSEYAERDMTYRLPADHLLSLIYYNVYRAFHLNIQRLGLSFDGLCLDHYQSKFPTMSPHDPSLSLLPPDLRPTQLQRSIPHHPMWDLFPDPVLRDNVLRYGEDNFDDIELCEHIFGDGTCNSNEDSRNRTGLIAWGPDPGSVGAWEVTEKFAKNWPWFLQNAKDLELSTNRWRAARGEAPIVFEVP